MKQEEFKILTDIDHVKIRPGMYIGEHQSLKNNIFCDNEFKDITYSKGLIKIISEVIDNSIDENTRTLGKFADVISIKITDNGEITIADNGRGIPHDIVQTPEGESLPIAVVSCTRTKAGSNFDDSKRTGIGTNGVGSALTNYLSKYYHVESTLKKPKETMFIVCKDGLLESFETHTTTKKNGTMIKFLPDYSFFGLENLDKNHIDVIMDRIKCLSISKPEIKFSINQEKVKSTFGEYFGTDPIYTDEKVSFSVSSSKDGVFTTHSIINGLKVDQGTIVDYIVSEVSQILVPYLLKKHKIELTASKLKQNLSIFIVANDFKALTFDSQTKERVTNPLSDVKEYFSTVDFEKVGKLILKDKKLIDDIVEYHKFKLSLKEQSELSKLDKTRKNIKSINKYHAPSGKSHKYLVITEGDSALNSIICACGRDGIGYFPLMGVPLNVLSNPIQKIIANPQVKNLSNILGFKFGETVDKLNFENILIASDADADGSHIQGLLLALVYKYCPEYLINGKVFIVKIPIATSTDKKGNMTIAYDYADIAKLKGDISYKKGLGSFTAQGFKDYFKNGIAEHLELVEYKEEDSEIIKSWLTNEYVDYRKEELNNCNFDINTV